MSRALTSATTLDVLKREARHWLKRLRAATPMLALAGSTVEIAALLRVRGAREPIP
jgi:hypothetical protein